MKSAILVHPNFDAIWPFAADELRRLWEAAGETLFTRLNHHDDRTASEIVQTPRQVGRLALLGVTLTKACAGRFDSLRSYAVCNPMVDDPAGHAALEARGVKRIMHDSEGFWGQSVAEFALALTLCGLRRIPQNHQAMLTSHLPWQYTPAAGVGTPGGRGQQFGDDDRFTHGTVAGKRVRIVGAGNIGSRYASFVSMLGAQVTVWDPFATEPCFHRAGARRERSLDRMMQDAEIFAPMLPLTQQTRGLVTAEHINALPAGCLVVLVTRAMICDMQAVRQRVVKNELSLAADVFDVEPLPLDDPLLGRHNVVHTPHQAGRTRDANLAWARALDDLFNADME